MPGFNYDPFAPQPGSSRHHRIAWLLLLLQLAGLLVVVEWYELEPDLHLKELVLTAIAGFLLQPFLPVRGRVLFFVLLSLAGLLFIAGPFNTLLIFLYGSLVISAARYLPAGRARYGGVLLLIGGLAALVVLRPAWITAHMMALSVLGSMFMFRLSIYLYERSHRPQAGSLVEDLAYFFMLPNMALLLFPAVDYATFLKGQEAADRHRIWKKGVQWMVLGVFHLVVYRLVYFYLLTPVSEVRDLLSFVQYALFNYALIIRLSGIFHTAVGVLCLFGFSLPPVFHNYFLATGFSDLWRRINIYFREYLIKVFYYPIFFRLRHRGHRVAVPVTILILFMITWLLHSFQWFWLKGQFPIRDVDMLFWGVFGVLVAANALLEMSKKREVRNTTSLKMAALQTARVGGMLLFMSVLWSLWSAPGIRQWLVPVQAALESPWPQFGQLGLIILAALTAGTLAAWLNQRFRLDRIVNPEPSTALASFWSLAMLAGLLALHWPPLQQGLDRMGMDANGLLRPKLTEADERLRIEGYYSDILIGNELTSPLGGFGRTEEEQFHNTDGKRYTGDFRRIAKEPNTTFLFKGQRFTINRWGMRDQDYDLVPPGGTTRALLLGGSFLMGSGVADEDVFDTHLEKLANEQGANRRFEFMNFGTASYDLLDCIVQFDAEQLEKFKPDYLFIFSHGIDGPKTIMDIARNLEEGIEMPYDFIPLYNYRAGVTRQGPLERNVQALEPFTMQILEESYRLLLERCRQHAITPVWVYWPPIARREASGEEKDLVKAMVRDMGYHILDLEGIYDAYAEKELTVSRFDMHPNALGHRLFAEALWRSLKSDERLGFSRQ